MQMLLRVPTSRVSKRRGFTLIEMGAVIVLIALFSMMVVPSIAHWQQGQPAREFPGKLLRLVSRAKQEAISKRESRSIGYDATTDEFRMFWTDPQTQVEQEGGRLAVPSDMQLGRVTNLGNDISVADWKITFYPDGTAEDAGIEVVKEDRYVTIFTNNSGQIKETRDPLPEQSAVRWKAGENEVRSQ